MIDDEKFKEFLEYATNIAGTKDIIEKTLNKNISQNDYDELINEITESIREDFEKEFTEDELDELLIFFRRPVIKKWKTFNSSFMPKIQSRISLWISKYITDDEE